MTDQEIIKTLERYGKVMRPIQKGWITTGGKGKRKKILCPHCGEYVVFVSVRDDEGNRHGELGCEYESNPWSGLSYALHHEGWGECILCTNGEDECMGGMLFDTFEEAIGALNELGR